MKYTNKLFFFSARGDWFKRTCGTTRLPSRLLTAPSNCNTTRKIVKSTEATSSPFLSPWAIYSRWLKDHPMKTKLLTSSFIMGAGDVACQFLTRYEKQQERATDLPNVACSSPTPTLPYDWYRTAKFFLLGGVLVGPALHHWYSFLIRLAPVQNTSGALKRLAVDQCIFAPAFIPVFFSGLQFLDGNFDMDQLRRKLKRDYKETLIANWAVWIPAMMVNFRFVPQHYQVLYSNAVGFCWNIFLSAISHK